MASLLRNVFWAALLAIAPLSHARTEAPREAVVSSASPVRAVQPLLQDGDVIFTASVIPIFRRVAETTQSWESHVGIAFRDAKGRWCVAESALPISKCVTLEHFVKRSAHGRFLVRRLCGGLTDEEKASLMRASRSRMGRLYNLGFNYDSRRLYCSKFVHDVYAEALGRETGQIETFRDVILSNPDAPLRFWKVWFMGHIPWDRRCITTTSILRDKSFRTVFDSEASQFLVATSLPN